MYFSKGHGERIHDIEKIDLAELESQPKIKDTPEDDMIIPAGCPFSGQRVSQVRRPFGKNPLKKKATHSKQKDNKNKKEQDIPKK